MKEEYEIRYMDPNPEYDKRVLSEATEEEKVDYTWICNNCGKIVDEGINWCPNCFAYEDQSGII